MIHVDDLYLFEEITNVDADEVDEMVYFGATGIIQTEEGCFYFNNKESVQ